MVLDLFKWSIKETPVNTLTCDSPLDVGKSSPCGGDREISPSDVIPSTEDSKVVSTAVFEERSAESEAGTAGADVGGSMSCQFERPGLDHCP
ncbi:hypothetical protein POX_f07436 [Penicillium oxalicum]|uniref:hypothetical protein n=1 Tax=Penicillium oxalicum TaxID=69781 RepID=UPI0020B8F529|nr:hypothetical protein POX_f07436 [Penicillium oxalicum]KAI2787079.1 hypothetical protein POX_f07436 [Penicillium oxalicum]